MPPFSILVEFHLIQIYKNQFYYHYLKDHIDLYYKILVNLEEQNLNLTTRKQGVLVTSGETASIFSKIFKKVASVLIRESEF